MIILYKQKGYNMKIKKLLLLIAAAFVSLHARVGFEYDGISVNIPNAATPAKTVVVKRNIPKECLKVPITNETVWTGNYASPNVPQACKSTYVHTTGKLTPILGSMRISRPTESWRCLHLSKRCSKTKRCFWWMPETTNGTTTELYRVR